jgi:SAM-dependent methyltransferase
VAYPERIIPDETEPGIVALHLKRYEFALDWCTGRDVLDAACGTGYGSALLARSARSVVGVDISGDAIAYAKQRYGDDGIRFLAGDVTELPFTDGSFDVVCSFETVEHLDDPDRFVHECARVLRGDGTLLMSTPCVPETTRTPENPFHRVELAPVDFADLLRRRFGSVALYGQRRLQTRRHRALQRLDVLGLRRRLPALRHGAARLTGTRATDEVTTDDVVIVRDVLEGASEVLAVCTGVRA